MLGLKLYVGGQRGKLKLPSGQTNAEFDRAVRVQMNAVEDVPALMVGIGALAALVSVPGTVLLLGLCGLMGAAMSLRWEEVSG